MLFSCWFKEKAPVLAPEPSYACNFVSPLSKWNFSVDFFQKKEWRLKSFISSLSLFQELRDIFTRVNLKILEGVKMSKLSSEGMLKGLERSSSVCSIFSNKVQMSWSFSLSLYDWSIELEGKNVRLRYTNEWMVRWWHDTFKQKKSESTNFK